MRLSRERFAAGSQHRPGTIVALLALLIVALLAFVGLAIDVGMLAIAKNQVQNAADLAALTAARTLTGDSTITYNSANATTNAQNILADNVVLGQGIASSQLSLTYGTYDYNATTQVFSANYPGTNNVPYSAVTATVTTTRLPGAFSTVLGNQFLPNVSATAQAVHRPRDIALVMDLSASMRMGTCLGYDFYTTTRSSNNPDTAYPTFGHYSSSSAAMKGPSTAQTSTFDNYTISPSNSTASNSSYSLTYVNNFFQNAAYASPLVRAFDFYTSSDGGTTWNAPTSGSPKLPPSTYTSTPGGDVPLYLKGSSPASYAQEVEDVVSGAGVATRNQYWELDGYSTCPSGLFSSTAPVQSATDYTAAPFYGYTQGPGYYGKTFFIWPPDPRKPLSTSAATFSKTTLTYTGAGDSTENLQFLADFGYTAADLNSTAVTTTLNGNITNIATSLTVASSASFPAAPFRIVIGTEILSVTTIAGNTWTVTRGVDGTTKAAHSSGNTIGLATGPALYGLLSVTTTVGSQTWPWPSGDDASGTIASSLSKYLINNVYKPGPSNQKLTTSDTAFKQLMRMYSWNYVIDNTGSTACDWRVRFFGTNNNTVLFNGSGSLNPPGSTGMCSAVQTYNAILSWIAASTDPFPKQLRAGRIQYYSSIPTSITGSYPSWGGTDQRFWVEYINYVLGYYQTGATTYQDISAMSGYGSDFNWGAVSLNAPPSSSQYMSYTDIPARPRLRCWFGGLTMTDFLQNFNMWVNSSNYFTKTAGDSYEAPLYTTKQACLAAVNTMENNHPNDFFTTVFYSWPRTSATATWQQLGNKVSGRFNCVNCPLGTNYAYARAAMFFPFSTIKADGSNNGTEVTPYDADPATSAVPSHNFVDVPRADGETCFAMGLMLAYNQFAPTLPTDSTLRSYVSSSPITFPNGMAGGMGRKGAQRVIIFETDGLANTTATASLVSNTGYNYYAIRYDMNNPNASEYPAAIATTVGDPTVAAQINSLVQQLASDYGSSRNPFRLYALGFGPVFSGTDASTALQTLQNMQYYAGTQSSASTALPSAQIITGNDATMSANMITTFTNILQNGVQIALIK